MKNKQDDIHEKLDQNFNEVIAFLRQHEEQLTGKIVEIPIEPQIWQVKSDYTMQLLKDFTKYSKAASPTNRKGKGFSEYIEESNLKQAEVNAASQTRSTAEEWMLGDWNVGQTPLEVISLFLDSQYEPPARPGGPGTQADPVGLQVHLLAYLIYQKYIIPSLGFFYPTVNERIKSAGLQLIGTVNALIPFIIKRGQLNDRSKSGGEKPKYSKAITEALRIYLTSNPKILSKSSTFIANAFAKKHHESNCCVCKVNGILTEIYCNKKGVTIRTDKYGENLLKLDTLRKYIPGVKDDILKEQSQNPA